MTGNDEYPALRDVIAANVRRLRLADGLTQDKPAKRLREVGLDMTGSAVAALERGSGRVLDMGEFVLLCVAFMVEPAELLEGPERARVGDSATVDLPALGGALVGVGTLSPLQIETPEVLSTQGAFDKQWDQTTRLVDQLCPGMTLGDARLMKSASRGEAEQKVARHLHVPPLHVAYAAWGLWRRSLTEERERRAAPRLTGAPERSARMIRAHVTRALEAEIRNALDSIGNYASGTEED